MGDKKNWTKILIFSAWELWCDVGGIYETGVPCNRSSTPIGRNPLHYQTSKSSERRSGTWIDFSW